MYYSQKKELTDEIRLKKAEVIFMGDSRVERAVKDSLLPNAVNVARESESLLFTYYKLKTILDDKIKLKRVILGFDCHSMSNYYDDYIYGAFSKDISSYYFFTLPPSKKISFLWNNRSNLIQYIKNIETNIYSHFFTKKIPWYLQGYNSIEEAVSAQAKTPENRTELQFYQNNKLRPKCSINLEYLSKIKALCKENNIELSIMQTPTHPNYLLTVPRQYKKWYKELLQTENLTFLNYDSLNIDRKFFKKDGDHLSTKGAIIFTNTLKKQLDK